MKRILALALCLLLGTAALAETYLVSYYPDYEDGYISRQLLLRDDGTVVVDSSEYAQITEISPAGTPEEERRFAAMRLTGDGGAGKYAMMDANGRLLTDYEYEFLYQEPDSDIIRFYKSSGATGVLGPDGAVLVEGAYRSLLPNGEGRWLALTEDGADGRGALVSIEGGEVTESGLHCDYITPPDTPGDPFVLSGVAERGGNALCVDADLRPCFEGDYAFIESFRGGYAQATPSGGELVGAVDAAGRQVLPAEYRSVTFFGDSDDAVLAVEGDELGFALFDGATFDLRSRISLREIPGADYATIYTQDDDVNVVVYDAGYNWLMNLRFDSHGRPLPADPENVNVYSNYSVELGNAQRRLSYTDGSDLPYHLVDLERNRRSADFQDIGAGIWMDGHGRYVFSTYDTYEDADGYTGVNWFTMRSGVIDEDGNTILEPVYTGISLLDLDRFWVQDGRRAGMIDSAGNWYYTVNFYEYLMD